MTLADLYSAIDSAKRRGAGLLGQMTDPATLGDLAKGMGRGLLTAPADIGQMMSNLATGQPGNTQGTDQLRGLLGQPTSDAQAVGEAIGPPVKTAAKLGALAAGKMLPGLLGAHIVYHGSPYQFDKFDMSKIGTGEGAQAYGHGLYFAENPETADAYRKALSAKDFGPLSDVGQEASWWTTAVGKSREDGIANLLNALGDPNMFRGWNAKDYARKVEALQYLKDGGEIRAPDYKGQVYKADINADPAHYLDWDKPVTQQSPQVQTALARAPFELGHDPHGADVYDMAQSFATPGPVTAGAKDPAGGSALLRQLGIPGIKYKDAGSRGTDAGTHNYVVFDDSLINNLGAQP